MENLKYLSRVPESDWAAFMVGDAAYVRPVVHDGIVGFAIYAADGTPITVMPTRAIAEAAIRQNGLEPLAVH